MSKSLKRFNVSFFTFRGEIGLGIGLSPWAISFEFFFWHLSISFLTNKQREDQERAIKFLKELKSEPWYEVDDL